VDDFRWNTHAGAPEPVLFPRGATRSADQRPASAARGTLLERLVWYPL